VIFLYSVERGVVVGVLSPSLPLSPSLFIERERERDREREGKEYFFPHLPGPSPHHPHIYGLAVTVRV
jgi:hypothetical protein